MEVYEERAQGNAMPNSCTLKEYRKRYAPEHLRKNITNLALVGYLLGLVNVGFGLWDGNPARSVIGIVLLGLNAGLHMNKSKLCAVCILVGGLGDLLMSFVWTGTTLSTWGGWIALGVYALFAIREMDKEFKREIQRRNR